jgi:hypothetical protein
MVMTQILKELKSIKTCVCGKMFINWTSRSAADAMDEPAMRAAMESVVGVFIILFLFGIPLLVRSSDQVIKRRSLFDASIFPWNSLRPDPLFGGYKKAPATRGLGLNGWFGA